MEHAHTVCTRRFREDVVLSLMDDDPPRRITHEGETNKPAKESKKGGPANYTSMDS